MNYLHTDGCHYESHAEALLLGDLGCCGCDDLDTIARAVVWVLTEYGQPDGGYNATADPLYILARAMADNADWLEHGTAIRGSWHTERGAAALAALLPMALEAS